MVDLDSEEIDILEGLMNKASVILREAVNNGFRPEFKRELERYEKIHRKLAGLEISLSAGAG